MEQTVGKEHLVSELLELRKTLKQAVKETLVAWLSRLWAIEAHTINLVLQRWKS